MPDPRQLIDASGFSPMQIGVVAMCMLMNILDGMDVMVISYAAPSLTEEWEIPATQLGVVFSAALLGMAVGSMVLAPRADWIGRRRMILTCIVVMGGGVLATAAATEVWHLVVLRFVSGLGIGAMLASTVTLASEYVPQRQRNLVTGLVLAGYPIGATLSGLVAAQIIPALGWRAMFITAGAVTLATFPLVAVLLAESWDWLIKRQPPGALSQLNRILGKMGHDAIPTLPERTEEARHKPRVNALMHHGRREGTVKLWVAFFMGFATLYYLITWIPNLARNTGLSVELAIYAGTIFNLGAIFGNVSLGYCSQRIGLKKAIAAFYLLTAAVMAAFLQLSGDWMILITFGVIGFGSQGGLVGLYVVGARLYPTEIRNTGMGWALGAGRTGAILSPTIGGALVAAGVSLAGGFLIFAAPLAIACGCIWAIKSAEID